MIYDALMIRMPDVKNQINVIKFLHIYSQRKNTLMVSLQLILKKFHEKYKLYIWKQEILTYWFNKYLTRLL